MILIVGAEQEDLGVELLERLLELLRVAHERDRLHTVVRLTARVHGAGVGVVRRAATEPEQRKRRGRSDAVDDAGDRDRLRALTLRLARRVGIHDERDDRDPVALGDALAEMA